MERVRVLDVPVDIVDMDSAILHVQNKLLENSQGNYILAVNPEKVFALKNDQSILDIFENASLLIPDGIGIVKAIRLLYKIKIARVPGADLMQKLCEHAAALNHAIYIYGGSENVNSMSCEILKKRFPDLNIAGRSNGYIPENKMEDLLKKINECRPDILFVGLGSPKQEQWITANLPKLNVKVCQGIGGTLDTIVGTVKRAPLLFQKMGLEWFYRLIREPRRFRRQLVLPKFVFLVFKERINKKK